MIHICTLHLNTCKRDCHQKQWEKIGLTAFNMNANHEHQHNTRKHTKKHYARSLGKKSMEEKIQNRKTPRKPQKKREQSPDKKVAWEILSKPFVFGWFSQGFCWLTRIRRQESCVPKTSWNHELCPTPKKNHHSTEITRACKVPLLRKISLVNHTCKWVVKIGQN